MVPVGIAIRLLVASPVTQKTACVSTILHPTCLWYSPLTEPEGPLQHSAAPTSSWLHTSNAWNYSCDLTSRFATSNAFNYRVLLNKRVPGFRLSLAIYQQLLNQSHIHLAQYTSPKYHHLSQWVPCIPAAAEVAVEESEMVLCTIFFPIVAHWAWANHEVGA